MNASNVVRGVGAVALISLCTACSTWNGMSRNQKATTEGAATGAVVGGLVGGPVGAAVGAGAGGYVAHEAGPGGPASKTTASNAPSSTASNAPSSASNAPSYSSNAGNNYGSASSYGGSNMASSQSRDEIRSVQQTLNDRGYNVGQVDGIMGPHTRSALEQFQQANNLPKSGQLDQQTLAALGVEQGSGGGMDQTASNNASTNNPSSNNPSSNNASRSNASRSNASSSNASSNGPNASDMTANGSNASGMSGGQQQDTISSVQQALNDRGYNAGHVDGKMGPQTRGALEKFQQSNGLKKNGQLDQQTLAALGVSQSNPQQLVNETASNGTGGTSASTTNAIPNASNGYNAPGSSSTASNNNPSNASASTNDTSNSSNTASSSNPSTSSSTSPSSSSSNDGSTASNAPSNTSNNNQQ